MNQKNFLKIFTSLVVCSGFFWACSGEDEFSETINVVEEGNVSENYYALDSIAFQDSLFSWFLDGQRVDVEKPSKDEGEDTSEIEGDFVDTTKYLLPPAGFYSSFVIPPPVPTMGGDIFCNMSGSAPTMDDWYFDAPLSITKNTVLRCAEFVNGEAVRSSSQTYFIDEDVDMPVVAISVDDYDMFDPKFGYYSQGVSSCREPCYEANYWKDIELPVHVEYFENGYLSKGKAWEIDAGLSIMGAWSRYNEKKSVSITMRKQYQDGRLKYPLFKTRPENKKFKAFNLRNNGNRFVGDYIEDPMLSSLLEGSGVDYQRSRQVVVYYNGNYHGIYDMREKANEHFIETNHGIDSKDVDIVKHGGDSLSASGGTTQAYEELLDLIATNDFSGNNNVAYKEASEMMDIGNYADYMAAEIYYHNGDWPDNNVRVWRATGQPFKFVIFDLDHGFGWDWAVSYFDYMDENMFGWIKRGGHSGCNGAGCFAQIYVKLSKNPEFRRLFANHGAVMLDYYLTYDRVVAATNAINATISERQMNRDQSLYASGRRSSHSFDKTGASLVSYAKGRSETVRDEYRKEFGLGDDIKVTIKADGGGSVLLDGMRLPKSDYTGTFFEGNDMLLTAVDGSGMFDKWDDGSTENPRLVSPKNGSVFKAIFK